LQNRVRTLKTSLKKEKLDGYVIADEINILYFTCFSGATRLLVPREGEGILYVYGVNYEDAKATARNCKVELVKRGEEADKKVADVVKNLEFSRVGFDALSASTYMKLAKSLKGVKLKDKSNMVWKLRMIKDETELNYMRRAAALTSEGMKAAIQTVKAGLREFEVAAEIEYAMRRRGSGGIAFDTTVASGVRSAYPHGGCTDRKIRKGDFVVLDIGAKYQNYRSDLTRTLTVGEPSSKQQRVYRVVKEAQEKAFQNVRAGVKACNVDTVARELIENEGYGEYFVHSLGHGVGLEIHESPTLGPESKDKLRAGNVVTVEPGIYIVDFGGVRIEDTVLVRKGRAEKLTDASYELQV
jgi:Xaa-Pro aminopeptidase